MPPSFPALQQDPLLRGRDSRVRATAETPGRTHAKSHSLSRLNEGKKNNQKKKGRGRNGPLRSQRSHPPVPTQKWGSGAGGSPPRGPGSRGKRGRSSDVTGSPGPAPSPGRGRGHRGGFLAARWGRHGRGAAAAAAAPPPPPPLLSPPPPSHRWDCPGATAPAPAPALRQGGTSPPRLPGVSSEGVPARRGTRQRLPPTAEAAAAARGAARCASRSPLAGPGPRGTGTAGRAHTHTRTDTQRDGADAEIPEVPPCRPPGRASPHPRPPGPPRPGAAGETHRRAAHPAAATTFHPGRQPAAAASPSAAGSGRGRKYEEEARRALRRGAPFLARDAGFAGGGCAAAVGFLHQLRGCVCTAHTCVSVCVCALRAGSPCPAEGCPPFSRTTGKRALGRPPKGEGARAGLWVLRRGIWHFFFSFFFFLFFFFSPKLPDRAVLAAFHCHSGFQSGFAFESST
ncbi:uncharacterized protein LOC143694422 [Agelaius phoeniceus]|uniref:uncharacterized protein LOC143694422 n=1 Tax=Agelaius phoeniceus TaxID=39638 RepID=UPI004054A39B